MVPCKSSGLQSSSAAIVTRPCLLHAVTIVDAAAACTAIAYDNKSAASGTEVAQVNATVNASTNTVTFNNPVECSNGIYVALTGASAKYIVHYSLI